MALPGLLGMEEDFVGPVVGLASSSGAAKSAARLSAPKVSSARVVPAKTRTTYTAQPAVAARTTSSAAAPAGGPGAWTAVPGHPSYGLGDFAHDPYAGAYGTCTWYAWYRHQGEPLMRLGDAWQWASRAPSFGLAVGANPVVGATAVFQPGVQGAGGGGHVGHVEQILGNGWFIISEMNFYWNGGGFGRVDERYVHTGPGVSFIY